MRILPLFLTSLAVATVSAGIPKPEVVIGLNVGGEDAQSGKLGGLEPRIKWQTQGHAAGGLDYEAGMDATVTDTTEAPMTFVWGKLTKVFSRGDVSIRGEMNANKRDLVDLDVRANGLGASLQVVGQADIRDNVASISVKALQVSTDIDTLGGTLTLNPKYDIGTATPNVKVGYRLDDGTSVQVDAERRRLTIAKVFVLSPNDKIVPSMTAQGDVSLSYTRSLGGGDGGQLTTTYTPDKSIRFQWTDGDWDTTITAPLEGYYKANAGIKINMKRVVRVI